MRSAWCLGVAPAAILAAALALATPAGAESRLAESRALRADAEAAIKSDDLATAEAKLEASLVLAPNHPSGLARLISVQALRGETSEALTSLDRYARLGLLLNMERPERAKLKTEVRYGPIGERLAANAEPQGKLAWSLSIDGAAPLEGVAYDPKAKRLFLSLVGGKAILAGDRVRGFASLTAEGAVGPVFGMAYASGVLWAAEASGDGIPLSSGPPATALVKIDARSGTVLGRYPVTGEGKHQLGDVTVGPDGTVYAIDTVGGPLYRLKRGAKALELFTRSDEVGNPQGMVVLDGGKVMVLSDYLSGMHRVDLATGAVEAIAAPDDATLITIDSLSRKGADLYATQNGLAPARILRLQLSPDARRVTSVETILSAVPEADDLALGVPAGGEFVFSAKAGWAGFDGDGKPAGPQAKPVLAAVAIR